MPKIKIDYGNMIFYKVYCLNPSVKKIFIGHTTNMVQRKHVLKKQTEVRNLEMFDIINNNGGWKCWRIKEIEKYNDCKTHADILIREKYHYDILENLILSGQHEVKKIKKEDQYLDIDKANNNYKCEYCEYECEQKKHFQQHIGTRKHHEMVAFIEMMNEYKEKVIENVKFSSEKIENASSENASQITDSEKKEYKCIACGKIYKNMSGLCKHRHICKKKLLQKIQQKEDVSKTIHNECDCDIESTELMNAAMPDKEKDEIIIQLLKDNESMKTFMKEQNNMLKEMMRQINTNGSSTITTTNNIKQKFNINIFLNEQCKDAINMCDFIKSLKITFHDLEITRDKSLEESVSTIMLRGLKELDVYKRPIHCTDQKRDVMYIKDEEKWEKDDGNVKLKKSIGTLSKKQMFTLKELRDSDPEIKTNDEKKDRFITTMNRVCTPIPETSEKKLIKTIGKEMYIDKDEE
jgi:ferredoxin